MSKLRQLLWPVYGFELKKLVPMLLMFFLITFNYTILRDTKDTLVVTAPGSGAEIIPFLKVWLVVPAAIIMMLLYAKLSNTLSKQKLFYVTLAPFLLFFALFAFVLYPAREWLHPTTSADYLQAHLPQGLSGLIALFRNWTFALFYVLAELWGSVMLSLVFWGFANQITHVQEAKRFYTLFALGGNIAPFFSGLFLLNVPSFSGGEWASSLQWLMSAVLISGALIAGCYAWMNRYILVDPKLYDVEETKRMQSAKPKLSLKESFYYLAHSRYIGCIALLVIAYGLSMNLIEVTWKHQMKLQYADPSAYSAFMGRFSLITGIASFMLVLLGGGIIRRFGWSVGALSTPIVLFITGVLFFTFVLFHQSMQGLVTWMGTTPLMCAVLFGAAQNILSKCTKYSLFDPTKEMAYIPLDEEAKVKGKAAIDVVGSRLGKSGGALVQQGLLFFCGSVSAMTPYVALLLFVVIGVWILAVRALGKQFEERAKAEVVT